MDNKKKRKFICIICPKSCELETDGTEVTGEKCKRGKQFALQEIISPLRVITTTIRYENKNNIKMIPVKTSKPVPLNRIFDIMKEIKKIHVHEIPDIGSKIAVTETPEQIDIEITGE